MRQFHNTASNQLEGCVIGPQTTSSVLLMPPMVDVKTLVERRQRKVQGDESHLFDLIQGEEDEPSMPTTSVRSFRSCLTQSLDRLNEIMSLQANWNSYGAEKISEAAVGVASDLIHTVQERFFSKYGERIIPSEIVPLDDGGVQIAWQSPGSEIEIEIGPSNEFGFLVVEEKADGRNFFEEDDVTFGCLIDNIEKIMAS